MKNILIVDEHPLMLEIMRAVARIVVPGAEVQLAADLPQALDAARAVGKVDLVLLDLGLPGCFGISALTLMREATPDARIVVISAVDEPAVIIAALAAGAAGYIPKTSTPDVLIAALRLVAAGGTYVPPEALWPATQESELPQRRAELTARQLEVLRLITQGFANKEIARHLRIAKDTVKQHAKAVYAAFGIVRRSQAARAAEKHGISLD